MDLTYFMAAFVGMAAGIVGSTIIALVERRFGLREFSWVAGGALAANICLLISLGSIASSSLGVLALDALLLPLMTAVGCVVGSLPAIIITQGQDF